MLSVLCPFMEKIGPKLGFGGVEKLGSALGSLMWHVLPSRRKLAIDAIEFHLNKSRAEATEIARKSFAHNCRSFLELFLVPHVNQDFLKSRLNISMPENTAFLNNYDGGVVGTTGHLGAWEILAGILGEDIARDHNLVVVRKHKNPHMHQLIVNLRSARGAKVVDHRDAVFSVLKGLRRKGLCAFLVDHNCRRNEAMFLPFLNKVAAVNMGPAMLAVRSKAAIVPVCMIRENDGTYTFHVGEPLLPEQLEGTAEEKIRQATEFYNNAIQDYIRQYPEQWFWMHKRWKTRPESEEG